ncbi:hypothetical protein XACG117_3130011 [Xanthomonas citri pv. citri]|nr:hypothetical protein XACG117_3130011 [Xanthomonas citri pv. citri]
MEPIVYAACSRQCRQELGPRTGRIYQQLTSNRSGNDCLGGFFLLCECQYYQYWLGRMVQFGIPAFPGLRI